MIEDINEFMKNGRQKGFKKIQGIMLADEYHPFLNHKKVLEVLNSGNLAESIEYVKADEYKLDFVIDKK